jgi:hypothetical protein
MEQNQKKLREMILSTVRVMEKSEALLRQTNEILQRSKSPSPTRINRPDSLRQT